MHAYLSISPFLLTIFFLFYYQGDILNSIKLAKHHLIIKWTLIDPSMNGEFSEVVVSIGVDKVTAGVLTKLHNLESYALNIHDIRVFCNTGNAVGGNNKYFAGSGDSPCSVWLPQELIDKIPNVIFCGHLSMSMQHMSCQLF